MSMKIELIVTVSDGETGKHVLACDSHQHSLLKEVNAAIATLVEDGTEDVGVEQKAVITIGDLPYDESMYKEVAPGQRSVLEVLTEMFEGRDDVTVVRMDTEEKDSRLADAPDEAFMKPRSA